MNTFEKFSLGGIENRLQSTRTGTARPQPTRTGTARPQPTVIPKPKTLGSCDKDNCKLLYKLKYCSNHADGDKKEFLYCLSELGLENEAQMNNIKIVTSCFNDGKIDYDCLQKNGMDLEMVEYIKKCGDDAKCIKKCGDDAECIKKCGDDVECIVQGLLGLKDSCQDCLENNSLSKCCPMEKYDENFEIIIGLCIGGGVLLILLIIAIVVSVNNNGKGKGSKRSKRGKGSKGRGSKRLG